MPNVITFTPRPRPPVPASAPQADSLDIRTHLEEAAKTALDAADKIIAALDQIEDGPSTKLAEPNPIFTAMAAHAGQALTLREPIDPPEAPTLAESEVSSETEEADAAAALFVPKPLPWYGAGNVVSFAGIALLSLIVRG